MDFTFDLYVVIFHFLIWSCPGSGSNGPTWFGGSRHWSRGRRKKTIWVIWRPTLKAWLAAFHVATITQGTTAELSISMSTLATRSLCRLWMSRTGLPPEILPGRNGIQRAQGVYVVCSDMYEIMRQNYECFWVVFWSHGGCFFGHRWEPVEFIPGWSAQAL